MSKKEIDRSAVMNSLVDGCITAAAAAEQLRLSIRQIKRIKKRVKKDGVNGLIHRGRGVPSRRKITQDIVDTIVQLFTKDYVGFGPTFAAEKLFEQHQIKICDESLRAIMVKNNVWKSKSKRKNGEHRSWRPRREHYGSMQQYDGCYHHWFEERGPECCLLLAVDDATGKVTHAWFDHHEGVIPTFNFWRTYIEKRGKPVSIYLDKFSTYKINHKAAEDNKDLVTQFQRVCQDLDIALITAHSPQAKGRVEREFETLQDRLVKELRLANISDIGAANIFLIEKFIPALDMKFSVIPVRPEDLHRPLTSVDTENMNNIFSIHSERVVMNDFTVQFKNQFFQLNQQQPVVVCRKDIVLVEEHIDGTIAMKLRDKTLAYIILPKRPTKAFVLNIPALTTGKPIYKPPLNHPWHEQYMVDKKLLQTARG